MFRRTFTRASGLIAVLAAVFWPQVASACPTCKDSLTDQYVAAYGWSIMFMMSMPFLILTFLGLYFYWEVRKARKQQQAAAEVDADQRMPVASG